jgi:hypothetical protein
LGLLQTRLRARWPLVESAGGVRHCPNVGQERHGKSEKGAVHEVWPFVLSLVITVGVAWASVAVQAMRAATVKPANVLYAE